MKASERAASHYHRVRPEQRFLSAFADSREKNLPRIALALARVHRFDGNKAALQRALRYHDAGAPSARLPPRDPGVPPVFSGLHTPARTVSEVRRADGHEHKVRAP